MHTTKVIYVFVAAIGITGTGAVSLPGSAEPKISARQPDAWVSYNNCPAADCSTGQGPPRVLWADDGCNGPLAESTRGMFLDTMGNDAAWRVRGYRVLSDCNNRRGSITAFSTRGAHSLEGVRYRRIERV